MEKQCMFKVYLYTDKDNMEKSFVEDIHTSFTKSERSHIDCAGFEDVLLVVNDLTSIYTDKQYFVHVEYIEVNSKNKVFETEWDFELPKLWVQIDKDESSATPHGYTISITIKLIKDINNQLKQ